MRSRFFLIKKIPASFLMSMLLIGGLSVWGIAMEHQGGEHIRLSGGNSGDVSFPHWVHQKAIPDCMHCHVLFPQGKNAIGTSKTSGLLKNKQVMDDLCLRCHRQLKKENRETGPVSCKACHKKE